MFENQKTINGLMVAMQASTNLTFYALRDNNDDNDDVVSWISNHMKFRPITLGFHDLSL